MPRLEGKVALISGAARGQGEVEARMFAQEGARVVIGDILDDLGIQVLAEINETGGECLYVIWTSPAKRTGRVPWRLLCPASASWMSW